MLLMLVIHTSDESGLSLTLSSALNRISLSGKAPSRGIHSSRTSCGLESSCLTGTTSDPIGWSHALESYGGKECSKGKRWMRSWHLQQWTDTENRNSTYLHNEHLLPGIMNQEVERLTPQRWSRAITHLQRKKGRIQTGGVTVKSLTGNSLFYILAQRRIDIFPNSSDLLFYIAPVDGAKVHLFE